jgi:hypothetical protein
MLSTVSLSICMWIMVQFSEHFLQHPYLLSSHLTEQITYEIVATL